MLRAAPAAQRMPGGGERSLCSIRDAGSRQPTRQLRMRKRRSWRVRFAHDNAPVESEPRSRSDRRSEILRNGHDAAEEDGLIAASVDGIGDSVAFKPKPSNSSKPRTTVRRGRSGANRSAPGRSGFASVALRLRVPSQAEGTIIHRPLSIRLRRSVALAAAPQTARQDSTASNPLRSAFGRAAVSGKTRHALWSDFVDPSRSGFALASRPSGFDCVEIVAFGLRPSRRVG